MTQGLIVTSQIQYVQENTDMLDFFTIKELSVKHTVKIIRQGTHWGEIFANTYMT